MSKPQDITLDITLENGSQLLAVKIKEGWIITSYGKEGFQEGHTYLLYAKPRKGEKLEGTFKPHLSADSHSALRKSWHVDSPVAKTSHKSPK